MRLLQQNIHIGILIYGLKNIHIFSAYKAIRFFNLVIDIWHLGIS